MKFISFVAAVSFCLSGATLHAQEAKTIDDSFLESLRVVEDKEGSANVRASASLDAKVTGKVPTGSVVAAFSTTGDWTEVESSASDAPDQYMHKTRLKKLSGWKQVDAVKGGDDKSTASYAGAQATVQAAPFVAKEHKIKAVKDGPTLVDGRHPWGVDGGLPTRSLSLSVKLDGKAVEVPAEATRDLFEPSMDTLVILTPGKPSSQMVVAMWNSDGAGGYLVAWSFVNGKYTGRAVMSP